MVKAYIKNTIASISFVFIGNAVGVGYIILSKETPTWTIVIAFLAMAILAFGTSAMIKPNR